MHVHTLKGDMSIGEETVDISNATFIVFHRSMQTQDSHLNHIHKRQISKPETWFGQKS